MSRAFTLCEMVVVIVIIALFLSMTMEALSSARRPARLAICQANHKNLVNGWAAYYNDNNGNLVDGHTQRYGDLEDGLYHWAEPPVQIFADGTSGYRGEQGQITLEYELNGIRHGALYQYIGTTEVYHCPSDDRSKYFGPYTRPSSFRSYSIVGPMNGEYYLDSSIAVKKISQVTSPAEKFVFLDDFDNRGWNMGSWIFGYNTNPNNCRFFDPIAYWHLNKGVFSYADGHVGTHDWQDPRTIQYAASFVGLADPINSTTASYNNPDVDFLARGYKSH